MKKKVLQSMLMDREKEISELRRQIEILSSDLKAIKEYKKPAGDILSDAGHHMLGYEKYLQQAVRCYLEETRKAADDYASNIRSNAESYAAKLRADSQKEHEELFTASRHAANRYMQGAGSAFLKCLEDMKNMMQTTMHASEDMVFQIFEGKTDENDMDAVFARSMANVLSHTDGASEDVAASTKQSPNDFRSVTYKTAADFSLIGPYGFRNNVLLTQIIIPEGVEKIRPGFFFGCTNLQSVTLPSSLLSIGDYAFFGCTKLTQISFTGNSKLEQFGNAAFSSCISLQSFQMPKHIKYIGSDAFKNCISLAQISMDSDQSSFELGAYAFQSCGKLSKIMLPKALHVINEGVFDGCYGMKYVVIPENVTDVKKNAFLDCTSLHHIVIEPSLLSLEHDSYKNLPDDVKIYVKTSFVKQAVLGVLPNAQVVLLDADAPQAIDSNSAYASKTTQADLKGKLAY